MSSTSSVIAIAKTPSLKASVLPVPQRSSTATGSTCAGITLREGRRLVALLGVRAAGELEPGHVLGLGAGPADEQRPVGGPDLGTRLGEAADRRQQIGGLLARLADQELRLAAVGWRRGGELRHLLRRERQTELAARVQRDPE